MTTCQNCGGYVSDAYARVFGDNDDEVHRCRECATFTDVNDGAAAGRDLDRVEKRPDGPNQRGPRDKHEHVVADGGEQT